MNIVERIKALCAERGISIAKLERDCDFSNGYIGKLKRGTLPLDKAQKIAEYLDVSLDYLLGVQNMGPEKETPYYITEETARIAQAVFENPDLRVLFDAAEDNRSEDIQMAAEMLKRFKETNPDG